MDDVPSKVARIVRQAGRIVVDADLPEALREHAFARTLDVLLRDAGLAGAGSSATRPAPAPLLDAHAEDAGIVDAEGPLAAIATRVGISPPEAREVYRLEHDRVVLVVGDKKLDRTKATGSRQITLLVAGGRQAAGFEEWTPLAHARELCAIYNRLDSKNYAATVKAMADAFNLHGQGIHREVRLTMPGWDEWAELVRRLASPADRTR